ncbi:MAG TPA: FKBP-type peptidyl-prolyl cis-trans isomerase [Prolixibacteraceae bacterium]|nr:FKBP-type peptidyl-prolyl cis-trans isomerase [Prolixibacteraceae bacterium]HOS00620.1 FKBP-type peptidyl-prolyl cis-trans isomerase [Prolixibacteraceae bacterium]HOS89978.1 FKBP-type peptidyl-prolyl cis-trans isomerase [Prolixibacteraceae bacterium]HPL45352.1 FKBP-type peptidyl-prolyl cis-trans isomerase [Prolixibacteraceae bacterium]HQJ85568.1 FKBP-type peptidyl-prolyl cis-trans isomerase [Prolixibacteraceae bacterium]
MEIGKNKMVTVTYDLMTDDDRGEMIEQATAERPLHFLFGAGMMLPKFEEGLAGLTTGQTFEITLNHKDAYGEVNADAVVELPRHIFLVDGKFDPEFIREGNTIPMMSGRGERLNGLVLEVTEESVRMDFNHPLAGEDLFFRGAVIDVREATEEEIVKALTAECGGGCSSGCCGDSGDGCGSGCGC